jgi:DNA repair ATPase RecN
VVRDRLAALDRRVAAFRGSLAGIAGVARAQEADLARLRRDHEETAAAHVVLQGVADTAVATETTVAGEVATVALREAFPDQDLRVTLEPVWWRGRPGVKVLAHEGEVAGPPLETFGGGIAGLLSVVFRVMTVVARPRLARVLVLDEPLTHVSRGYQEGVARFLQGLARDLGFRILVITHLRGLASRADRHYVARKTQDGTVFERVT